MGLGIGLYLFIFSGGTPWTSGGIANGVLGWPVKWPWLLIAVTHFAVCLIDIGIVALVIYRLHWILGIIVGTAVTMGLYFVQSGMFATNTVEDGRALTAHFVLGLFGSALYKAISVPKPYMTPSEKAEVHRSDPP